MTGRGSIRLALAVALTTLCGCSAPSEAPVTDDVPQRIVVFAPSSAEVLAALGLADRVVAIGSHGPWPSALASVESVGNFDGPDLERIVELESDLVLTTASVAAADGYRRLEQLGVAVEALDTSTFEGLFDSLERIGELFDRRERAAELAGAMRDELDAVRAASAEHDVKRVLLVVGRDPLYVAGPGSHLDELIRIGGGENVAHDAASPYQQYSIEAVLERRPEVIVDMSGDAEYWSRWPFLPAVGDGSVYRVEPEALAIPGMRLPEMARLMAGLIHPPAETPATD